jgi:hypothetical protein
MKRAAQIAAIAMRFSIDELVLVRTKTLTTPMARTYGATIEVRMEAIARPQKAMRMSKERPPNRARPTRLRFDAIRPIVRNDETGDSREVILSYQINSGSKGIVKRIQRRDGLLFVSFWQYTMSSKDAISASELFIVAAA